LLDHKQQGSAPLAANSSASHGKTEPSDGDACPWSTSRGVDAGIVSGGEKLGAQKFMDRRNTH